MAVAYKSTTEEVNFLRDYETEYSFQFTTTKSIIPRSYVDDLSFNGYMSEVFGTSDYPALGLAIVIGNNVSQKMLPFANLSDITLPTEIGGKVEGTLDLLELVQEDFDPGLK